ncbi:helix-turn-helix domain-containing protein [Paenibacillus sp. SI8]|uniref:helix-turn-helix domain-containing protein n=1 Tax=unclassified Paenibacillus TaxID=185978 RepID=UPI0034654D20
MDKLAILIKKAKKNDHDAMKSIIVMFKPKLDQSMYQTPFQERADLKQEVCLKIVEAVHRYDLDATPGFWDFLRMIKINELSIFNYSEIREVQ